MDLAALQSAYNNLKPQLDDDLRELQSAISEAIANIDQLRIGSMLDPALFRIRLRESRVKKLDSIYRKAVADGLTSVDDALSTERMPDLIGARIVCNNIADVYDIVTQLKTARFGCLHYAERPSGEKDFIRSPKNDGYRGYHLDVVWNVSTGDKRQRRAELQIRTLLQDAWASFMHDDLYQLQGFLPPGVSDRARDMSEVLSAFDSVANEIRKVVEGARVSSLSNVGLMDALGARMYAYFSGFRRRFAVPEYRTVHRVDRYEIIGYDARYLFELEAESSVATSPRFVIAGDTGRKACQDKTAMFKGTDNTWLELGWVDDRDDENVLVAQDNMKDSRHHFRVDCKWRGIFSRQIEYVVAPWSLLYPHATVDYEITLAFREKPRKPPIALRQEKIMNLPAAVTELESQTTNGLPRTYKRTTQWHEYSFRAMGDDLDILLLFKP